MFDNKYPYLEMEKSIWLVKGNKKIREKIGKFKIMQVLKVGTLVFGNTCITCFILFQHVPCRIYIFEFCRQNCIIYSAIKLEKSRKRRLYICQSANSKQYIFKCANKHSDYAH